MKLPHSAMLAVNSNLLSNILSGLKKAYLKESIAESVSFPMVILRVKADPFHLHPFTLPPSFRAHSQPPASRHCSLAAKDHLAWLSVTLDILGS